MTITTRQFSFEIDEEDYYRVTAHRWFLSKRGIIYNKYGTTIGRFIMRYDGPLEIDHKDRNILNNKKENLRLATRQQQQANRGPREGRKYKGISWNSKKEWYDIQICFNGKRKNLGHSTNEVEAAIIYNKAALKYFGEFAYLNEVI